MSSLYNNTNINNRIVNYKDVSEFKERDKKNRYTNLNSIVKCQVIYVPRVLISVRYETVHSERKK